MKNHPDVRRATACCCPDGLDSSRCISAITKIRCAPRERMGNAARPGGLAALYTVGLEGSPDLRAAPVLTAGTVRHGSATVQEGMDAIRGVIYHQEPLTSATIRASTPMPDSANQRRWASDGAFGERGRSVRRLPVILPWAPDARNSTKMRAQTAGAARHFRLRAPRQQAMSRPGAIEARGAAFLDKILDVAMRNQPKIKCAATAKWKNTSDSEMFRVCCPPAWPGAEAVLRRRRLRQAGSTR